MGLLITVPFGEKSKIRVCRFDYRKQRPRNVNCLLFQRICPENVNGIFQCTGINAMNNFGMGDFNAQDGGICCYKFIHIMEPVLKPARHAPNIFIIVL